LDGNAIAHRENDPTETKNAKSKEASQRTVTVVNERTVENSESSKVSDQNKVVTTKEESSDNYNSSCKFNFLFYFIYKVKYDPKDESGSSIMFFEF
jgi:hypothetical protein